MAHLRLGIAVELPVSGRFLAAEIDRVRNMERTEPLTRLLSCRACGTPFCTGVQRIGEVYNLADTEFLNLFQVGHATNLRLSEDVSNVLTAQLHGGRSLAMQEVACQQCNVHTGYQVIALEDGNAGNNDIAVGHYILEARSSTFHRRLRSGVLTAITPIS